MRHIIKSFFLTLAMLVSGFALLVPNNAEAATWCSGKDGETHCFTGKNAEENCKNAGYNNCFTNSTVKRIPPDGEWYCYFEESNQSHNCYKESSKCADASCAKYKDGKYATPTQAGNTNGKMWCYTTGVGRTQCADTKAECNDIAFLANISCEERELTNNLYCYFEDSKEHCFTDKDDCKYDGFDWFGYDSNNCVQVNPAESGSINKALKESNVFINPTIQLTGRFDYTPLESTFISKENAQLPNFLQYIFNVGIAIVGMAALLMMTIGGITYIMSAGNQATAGSAKKMIRDAALGLMLAFFSWLILFVINPDLVGISENLEKLTATSQYIMQNNGGKLAPGAGGTGQGAGAGQGAGQGQGGSAAVTGAGYDELEEVRVRALLDNAGVKINRPIEQSCKGPNDRNCTSVAGLPQKSIDAIVNLKKECPDCNVMITGGSEEAGHKSHGPGKNVFDLAIDDNLEFQFELDGKENPRIPKYGKTTNAQNWSITSGPLKGARVVKETNPPHYHIYWP